MLKNIMIGLMVLVALFVAFFSGVISSYDSNAPQRIHSCGGAYVKSMNGVELPEPETVTVTCRTTIYDPKTKTSYEVGDETKTTMSFEQYKKEYGNGN